MEMTFESRPSCVKNQPICEKGYRIQPSCENRPRCGNRPNWGNRPSCESYIYGKEIDLDLQNSHTFINSISYLHLPTVRSLAAIVSEKSTVFTFSP